jgi:hypothetical protein
MKLSREEDAFLKQWIFDEFHYESGVGPTKRLQLEHGVVPAQLSILIAAAIPDPADQKLAAFGPPPTDEPKWPWTEEEFRARLDEARAVLSARSQDRASGTVSVRG